MTAAATRATATATVDGRPMPTVLAEAVERYLAAITGRTAAAHDDVADHVSEPPAEEA